MTTNLFGDILSDLCAQLVGGMGFGYSGNIGDRYAVFEPTHGSAPKYAGQHKVNPLATILAAKMMLEWLGEKERAAQIEQAVAEAGFDFPPHPGEESALIGGMIATNAGGSRAVKYGVIRNYVRGLEVVTAAGDVLQLGGKLIKSSTGYNLMHLFIGSEGTLGVITKAVIQFRTKPALTRSLVIPFETLEAAIGTVPVLFQRDLIPLALEFVPLDVLRISEENLQRTWPSHLGDTHLFVILDAVSEEEMDRLSESLAEAALEMGALDVFIADTPAKQDNVLAIRSKIYEALKASTVEILDICVPRAEIRPTSSASRRSPPPTASGSRRSDTRATATSTPIS